MTSGVDLIFDRCPLCTSTGQDSRVPSLAKDLSKPGYSYVRCASCGSWYLADVRKTHLRDYYSESTAYESVSSKDAAANELASIIGMTGSDRVLDLGGGSGAGALPMNTVVAFDVIMSVFSLEHDCNPRALLTEARRCLAPRGRMIVLVPSADALQIAALGSGYYWFQAPWHTFIPAPSRFAHLV